MGNLLPMPEMVGMLEDRKRRAPIGPIIYVGHAHIVDSAPAQLQLVGTTRTIRVSAVASP
jgi:hypothetical protein